MAEAGWERGDLLDRDFPVHLEALRAAGPDFLTTAFRSTGSIGPGDRVAAITRLEPFRGGSTGRKALLDVTYAGSAPDLPEHLFVKFSRDLDDEVRDRGKRQMEPEVRFALLSQIPDFPVAVPRCLFGEYRVESGSGLLVSERIAFGADGIEPHHAKARDHELDDLLGHYDALVAALARLAGADRAGRFPDDVMAHFEARPRTGARRGRAPEPREEVRDRVLRYAAFAARSPQLLPPAIRSEEFIAELLDVVPRSVEHADALRAAWEEQADDLVAFCHWNANIDNAWFWRDAHGDLACGLMDWGNVGRMDVVTALASSLCFTEPDFLVEHLDHFLDLFAAVFEDSGGGPLDPDLLRRRFGLHVVAGGLRWPLGTVPLIERHVPYLDAVTGRLDPRIADDEFVRTQLHLLTSYLVLWQACDAREVIDRAVRRAGS